MAEPKTDDTPVHVPLAADETVDKEDDAADAKLLEQINQMKQRRLESFLEKKEAQIAAKLKQIEQL